MNQRLINWAPLLLGLGNFFVFAQIPQIPANGFSFTGKFGGFYADSIRPYSDPICQNVITKGQICPAGYATYTGLDPNTGYYWKTFAPGSECGGQLFQCFTPGVTPRHGCVQNFGGIFITCTKGGQSDLQQTPPKSCSSMGFNRQQNFELLGNANSNAIGSMAEDKCWMVACWNEDNTNGEIGGFFATSDFHTSLTVAPGNPSALNSRQCPNSNFQAYPLTPGYYFKKACGDNSTKYCPIVIHYCWNSRCFAPKSPTGPKGQPGQPGQPGPPGPIANLNPFLQQLFEVRDEIKNVWDFLAVLKSSRSENKRSESSQSRGHHRGKETQHRRSSSRSLD